MPTSWKIGTIASLAVVTAVMAQQPETLGQRLVRAPTVRQALEAVQAIEPQTLDEQVRLCEIAAPPFQEAARAAAYRDRFVELGLQNVRIDPEGNVLGERPGRSDAPHLVFSAHLDTVFPPDTDVRVTRDGSVMHGPGIADDCRGLAVLLAVVEALDRGGVETRGSITFVGTVGEEGLGDLRGVKHLFGEELRDRVDRFVSIDGTGYGITDAGVGSHRYRVRFEGPGGHSYGDFGVANPMHALGRAIAAIARFTAPSDPKTTFSVGRVGGGTSVNAIASEAWMEVDMRSEDPDALAALDAQFQQAVQAALRAENARWGGRGRLRVTSKLVGDRPAGRTARDSAVVEAAVSVTRALDLPVSLDAGSTDANVPMSLGIEAITIDGGGRGSGSHAPGEMFDATDSWRGSQRALLIAIALAELAEP